MTPEQLSKGIITPVLLEMDMYSHPAHDLLFGTAMHESMGLRYIVQAGYDFEQPDLRLARGYYQMEPTTLWDLYDSYLYFNASKRAVLNGFRSPVLSRADNLIMNPAYATAAARMQYYRFPDEIPDDMQGQAEYWKKYWNTGLGKGGVDQYIENASKYKYLLRC